MNIWDTKLSEWAREKADDPAIVDEYLTFTYSELKETVDALTLQFQLHQLHPQDRVIVILPRTALAAVILTSLLKNNLVGLFLDTKTNPQELLKTIKTVKPKAIVAAKLTEDCYCREIFDLNIKTTSFLKPRLFLLPESMPETSAPADLSWLLATSGTTGDVKAVMISAKNLIERTVGEIADFRLSPGIRLLNCLPFSHDLGLNQLLTCLYMGGTLQVKSKAVSRLQDYLQNESIKGLTGTPLLWADFLKGHSNQVCFPHIQFIAVSGGSMEFSKIKELQSFFPNARIIKTYGQTETFRTFINDDINSSDLGKPVSGVSIELAEGGELYHFGRTRMLGYLFDSVLTESRLVHCNVHGPGIKTNDLVRMTPDGKYFFIGRNDDAIKRFEQRFHLSEVEQTIQSIPHIAHVALVTIPAPKSDWRQFYLGAFVQLDTPAQFTSEQLMSECQQRLSYYKVPDFIKIVKEFPRTSSFKVDRRQLKSEMEKYRTLYAQN